jgi:tetratricopeptide (TPR) repeat protein
VALRDLVLCILFLSGVSVYASSSQEDFSRAIGFYSRKEYAASRPILQSLVTSHPENMLYRFNLGNVEFMLGDFAPAEAEFAAVQKSASPLNSAAAVYRAKALRALGDVNSARAILRQTLNAKNLPPSLADEATRDFMAMQDANPEDEQALSYYRQGDFKRALHSLKHPRDEAAWLLKALVLIKLDRQDQAHRILKRLDRGGKNAEVKGLVSGLLERLRDTYSRAKWLFVEASTGYDSNPRRAISAEPSGTAYVDLGAGGRVWSDDLWLLNLGYSGHLNETFAKPDLRVYSHELQLGFGRAAQTDLFMLQLFATHESWENSPVIFETGARLHLRTGNERTEMGLTASWSNAYALQSEDAFVAGTRTHARLYLGNVAYPFYAQAFLDGERQLTGDQTYADGSTMPTAFSQWGPGARLLWKADRNWALDTSLSYKMRDYLTLAQPGARARKDREWAATARVTRFFGQNLSAYFTVLADFNASSLDDSDVNAENYKRIQTLVGALWDAF